MQLKTLILALAVLPLTAQAAVNIQRWKTKEGTQILLVEHHENPIVDMAVSFKGAGSAFDPQNKSEVSEFTPAPTTLPPTSPPPAIWRPRPSKCAA